ncbi:MAG: hypothetical protein KF773_21125 [Deltaproteobacteria bacterium]|nr:hypothetical protein [Deltaproteobacteria bacterium]
MRWVWRGGAAAVILLGWIFILIFNNFHVTPPVVFVGLGYLAAVATIYNLFHTGVAVVTDEDEDNADTTWGRPMGRIADLEREKKTLVKAIKEADFDLQMGKLSKKDADEMIRVYRLRAIEVIKELDVANDQGAARSAGVREQIEREVRARLEVEGKGKKKAAQEAAKQKGKKGQQAQKAQAKKADEPKKAEKAEKVEKAEQAEKKVEKTDEKKSEPVEDETTDDGDVESDVAVEAGVETKKQITEANA